MDLTDEQWAVVRPLIPEPPRAPGRPWCDTRCVLDGILWVMRTGSRWRQLPSCYPSYKTCNRRYLAWKRSGVWMAVLRALMVDLKERGSLDLQRCLQDGSIVVDDSHGSVKIVVDPRLHGTWQLNTAFLFLTLAARRIPVEPLAS